MSSMHIPYVQPTVEQHPVTFETNQDMAAVIIQALDGVLRATRGQLDPSEDTLVLSALRTSLSNLLDEARQLDTLAPEFR